MSFAANERAAVVEEARAAQGIEQDALCIGAEVLVPILEHIKPRIVTWGKSRIPGIIRWLVGGVVDDVVDGIVDGLRDWKEEKCHA